MARILIIDDEPEIRALLTKMLEREGYEVIEAPDGEVGVKLFRENPTDLVITDIHMPNKLGLDVIADLRVLSPDVKIIAISGGDPSFVGADVSLEGARIFGAQKALPKPLEREQVLKAVRELLDE